jgi:hypothetical protein
MPAYYRRRKVSSTPSVAAINGSEAASPELPSRLPTGPSGDVQHGKSLVSRPWIPPWIPFAAGTPPVAYQLTDHRELGAAAATPPAAINWQAMNSPQSPPIVSAGHDAMVYDRQGCHAVPQNSWQQIAAYPDGGGP